MKEETRMTENSFDLLIEAEHFGDQGGWLLDSQFIEEMGSPYLLAHGLGQPVANARTTVHIPQSGEYKIWVELGEGRSAGTCRGRHFY